MKKVLKKVEDLPEYVSRMGSELGRLDLESRTKKLKDHSRYISEVHI